MFLVDVDICIPLLCNKNVIANIQFETTSISKADERVVLCSPDEVGNIECGTDGARPRTLY